MKLSETDTRVGLINPLFRALGWDFSDFTRIKNEVRTKRNDPIDYAFYNPDVSQSKPILLLEAKTLGTNLNDKNVVKQLTGYLGEMGTQWGLCADGNKYIMYNSLGGVAFEDQKFLTLEIKAVDTENGMLVKEFAKTLYGLLSREKLEDYTIQEKYEEHMITTKIRDAFDSLLSKPFDTLVKAIQNEFKLEHVKLPINLKIKRQQIYNFLETSADEEGRIAIDSEVVNLHTEKDLIEEASETKDEHVKRTLQRKIYGRQITIKDLLDSKLINEGDNFKLIYKGEVFWARVVGNGQMDVNGIPYPNPSKAGSSIIKGGCNGWYCWLYQDRENQKWYRIGDLRKKYRDVTDPVMVEHSLTLTQNMHLEFWESFVEYMINSQSNIKKLQTPHPRQWYVITIGRSKFRIALTTNTQKKSITCEIYISGKNAKIAFSMLRKDHEAIENILGQLDWQELPEGQECRIIKRRDGDTKNREEWSQLHLWLKENAEAFHNVFSPRIKDLVLDQK